MSFPPDLAQSFTVPYEDRKTGLTIFGILTILMGVVCALLVPLMLVSLKMSANLGGPAQDSRTILPAVLMYGALAVIFIWLGIGSIKARRWARALLLIVAWCALVIGIFGTVVAVFALPKVLASAPPGQPAPPPEALPFIMAISITFMVVLMVILPAVWVYFYGSRHVKATCEAADPTERWTDRCPLPVIAICLWMACGVPWMLFMAVAYRGVIPFFGAFLVGPAAKAIYFVLALLWGYAAWAMYKLRLSGWWIITITLALFSVSAFLTYSQHDVSELYRLMEYPADQIAQIERLGFLNGKGMAWLTLAGTVPMLAYMLFVRRYFAPRSVSATVS